MKNFKYLFLLLLINISLSASYLKFFNSAGNSYEPDYSTFTIANADTTCSSSEVGLDLYPDEFLGDYTYYDRGSSNVCPATDNGNSLLSCKYVDIYLKHGTPDTCRKVVTTNGTVYYEAIQSYKKKYVYIGIYDEPACNPLSEYTVNIPESDCSGSYTDTNNQVRGVLSYQQCDSTCYVTEAVLLTCDELAPLFHSSCDTTKNNFSFQCTDINGVAQVDTNNTFCRKKSNPCDDLYDRVSSTCNETQVTVGYPECKHDGLQVINPEVMKCVDDNSTQNPKNQKPWDCTSYFHKVWNDSNKTCECTSGYELSFYGSCKKSLDSNATDEQKNSADNDAKNDAQKEEQMKNDRNNTLEQNRHLSNIENTLSSVARDLNQSKSLLGSIKDLIGGLSSKFDSNGSSGVAFDPTTAFSDLEDGYLSVNNTVDELKNILANGLVNPIPSGSGNSCAYSNVITGNGMSIPVSFDPCEVVHPYYSVLYNIWYFLIFAMFLVFSIKLLLISKGD